MKTVHKEILDKKKELCARQSEYLAVVIINKGGQGHGDGGGRGYGQRGLQEVNNKMRRCVTDGRPLGGGQEGGRGGGSIHLLLSHFLWGGE